MVRNCLSVSWQFGDAELTCDYFFEPVKFSVQEWATNAVPAAVGQYFRVSAVDENGNVTAVEAVDAPSGGGDDFRLIRSFAVPDDPSADTSDIEWVMSTSDGYTDKVAQCIFDTDDAGNPFALSELIVIAKVAYGRIQNYFGVADQNGSLGYGNLYYERLTNSSLSTYGIGIKTLGLYSVTNRGTITANTRKKAEDITTIKVGWFTDNCFASGSTITVYGR